MSIREEIERELAKGHGQLTKLAYAQLLEVADLEEKLGRIGYKIKFHPQVPMLEFYRSFDKVVFPGYDSYSFQVLPRRPRWAEESGLVDMQESVLMKLPTIVEDDVIGVLAGQKEGLLRNPPEIEAL